MINKGKKKRVATIEKYLRNNFKVKEDYYYYEAAKCLYDLNDALLSHRSVFAVCIKEPQSLDKGGHYFNVHYVNKDGRLNRVSLYGIELEIGAKRGKEYMPYYVWYSKAIGMSRVFDATNGLFALLQRITGTYTQIHSIN